MMSGLVGLFTFVTGMARGYLDLVAVRFVNGFACGFIFAPSQASVFRWFKPGRGATATGVFMTAPFVGTILPLVMSGAIAIHFGSWRYSFWLLSAVPLTAGLLGYVSIKGGSSRRPERLVQEEKLRRADVYSVLGNRLVWLSSLARFGHLFASMGTLTWLPTYLVTTAGFTELEAGLLSSLLPSAGLFGVIASGIMADRLFKRRAVMGLVAQVISGATLLSLGFMRVPPLSLLIPVIAIFGFFTAATEPPAIGLLAEFGLSERVFGTAAGFSSSITHLGGVASPILFGLILDQTASYGLAWMTMGLVPLAFSFTMLTLVRKGY